MKKHVFFDEKGFSLMELIIYVGILAISSGLLVGILQTTTTTQVREAAKNTVSGQLSFAMQTIQRYVKESSYIDIPVGQATNTLKLMDKNTTSSSTDETYIYLDNGKIYIKENASNSKPITNDSVRVDSLSFTKFTQYPSKNSVQIDIAMTGLERSAGVTITRALRSVVSRASAVTFDSDLLPGADNSYQIGNTSYRWSDANFAGDINVNGIVNTGQLCLNGVCKTSWDSVSGITGSGTANYISKWTSSNSIGNSVIYDNGINVGIGTTNPGSKLDIYNISDEIIRLSRSSATSTIFKLGTDSALIINNNNIDTLTLKNGNVGILTTNPGEALDVVGNINISDGQYYKYGGQNAFRLAKGTDTYYTNTLIGVNAGNSSIQRQTAVGYYAGNSNSGSYQTAIGFKAGSSNIGGNQTAIGYYAGYSNSGNTQIAIGHQAGNSNSGNSQIAIGYFAGYSNSGDTQVAIGIGAGNSNTGNQTIGIGYQATKNNNANDVVAIGYQAGLDNTVANQFIVKQANINSTPLIQGDFSSGNLSIGSTTSSGYKFYVNGTSYFNGNLSLKPYATVDGYDISSYGPFWINSPGQSGQVWTSDGYGRGYWSSLSYLSGSGTNNHIPKWTSSGTLENSVLTDVGSTSGIIYINYNIYIDDYGIFVPYSSGYDMGVIGEGDLAGVIGYSGGTVAGKGVYGKGGKYGVYGESNTTNGYGVYGDGPSSGYDFYAGGDGINYGPFTGAHDVIIKSNAIKILKTGLVVSITGKTHTRYDENNNVSISSTLPEVKLSNKEKDPNVLGAFVFTKDWPKKFWYSHKNNEVLGAVNALGEGRVWVTNVNGEIKAGDYITTSNIPGYGEKQSDDLLHSYTLGKVIENINWSEVKNTVKYNGKTYKAYLISIIYVSG